MPTASTSGIQRRGNGRTLAIALGVGVVGTLWYMYVAGKKTRREEGSASIYKPPTAGAVRGGTDERLGSQQVREVVQGERKP